MIQLIGPGGAGKSTVGAALAMRLGCPFRDRETCVAETVRRQLGRPISRRDAAREEAVIRERFDCYVGLPAMKIETMRPAVEVAAAIHAWLVAAAPEALPPSRVTLGHPVRSLSPARCALAAVRRLGPDHSSQKQAPTWNADQLLRRGGD